MAHPELPILSFDIYATLPVRYLFYRLLQDGCTLRRTVDFCSRVSFVVQCVTFSNSLEFHDEPCSLANNMLRSRKGIAKDSV